MSGHGKRAGARPKRSITPWMLALLGASGAALIGWVALVWTAIHFGSQARGGDQNAWWWTALATIAAIGTLFACLMLLSGSTRPARPGVNPATQPPTGGKRAAR